MPGYTRAGRIVPHCPRGGSGRTDPARFVSASGGAARPRESVDQSVYLVDAVVHVRGYADRVVSVSLVLVEVDRRDGLRGGDVGARARRERPASSGGSEDRARLPRSG